MVDLEVQNQQFVIFGTDCYGILVIVGGVGVVFKSERKSQTLDLETVCGGAVSKSGDFVRFFGGGVFKARDGSLIMVEVGLFYDKIDYFQKTKAHFLRYEWDFLNIRPPLLWLWRTFSISAKTFQNLDRTF